MLDPNSDFNCPFSSNIGFDVIRKMVLHASKLWSDELFWLLPHKYFEQSDWNSVFNICEQILLAFCSWKLVINLHLSILVDFANTQKGLTARLLSDICFKFLHHSRFCTVVITFGQSKTHNSKKHKVTSDSGAWSHSFSLLDDFLTKKYCSTCFQDRRLHSFLAHACIQVGPLQKAAFTEEEP